MSIQDQIKKSIDKHSIGRREVVAYLLFAMIILVFVFFGFPGSKGNLGQGIIAEVNGELISGADLREELSQLERFYSQMFGGNFGMQAQRQLLENQAMENLITREILAQESTAAGILVSDKEVQDFILDIPAFKEQGHFDSARYKQIIEGMKMTPFEFETKIRKEAQRMRVKRVFDSVDTGSNLQSSKESEMAALKLNVQFVRMDRESLAKATVVSPSQVEEFLKNSDNMKKIEVDYESHKKDLYTQQEQVKAQHILIKAKDGDKADEQKALTKIMDLKTRSAKEDFAVLAKANSEDEGSKVKGGDLGFFGRGQMVPAFETAAFGAKVGDIVGPVKTNFGYHLIKVLDRKESKVSTLEEVKGEIAKKLIAETQLDEKFQKLEEALSKKDYVSAETQIKALNGNWDETGDFEVQADAIPKLAGGESLKEAVWKLNQAGQWLDYLVREGSVRYVIKMKDIKNSPSAKAPGEKLAGAGSLFEGWLEGVRQNNKVIRNQKAMSVE